ncbi:DUF3158 family protein [[Pasteurella] aerogenes]|nr:DUF3158 family protein [[Pasteurella] aerogenes]
MIKILRTLIKKTKSVATNTSMEQLSIGWYEPLSANKLLSSPLRQQYLKTIWQNVSMEPQMFNVLYKTPIEKYAEIVQLLPASESHHHSHIGGMLDHGLEVISIATKLRQSYILPQNSAPEEQAKQRDVWTAVVIYAALLHDIGKIAVDIEIMGLISEDMYRELAKNADVNNVLKQLFSHLETGTDYKILFEQVYQARTAFMDYQLEMVQRVKSSELQTLPIFMIKDKSSSSGGTFLRWRSMNHTGTGETVWQPLLSNKNVSESLRDEFVAVEKDRILVNMQVSIFNYILRQLSECASKIEKVEQSL